MPWISQTLQPVWSTDSSVGHAWNTEPASEENPYCDEELMEELRAQYEQRILREWKTTLRYKNYGEEDDA